MRRLVVSILPALLFLTLRTSATFSQPKPILDHFEIVGAHRLSPETIGGILQLHTGDSLSDGLLSANIQRLLLAYSDIGYPFVDVRPTGLGAADSGRVSLILKIAEGAHACVVACRIEGIGETDSEVVRREFLVTSRPFLTRELLDAGTLRLRQSGLFASVSEPELFRINDSSVGIALTVLEARSTSIDGVLGYAPAPSPGASGYVNGFLDLGFNNIGGSGRRASLRYQRLTPSTSDLAANYLEPWLAGWPIDVSLGLLRHDEDSLFVSTHVQLGAALHSISSIVIAATGSYDGVTPGPSKIVNESHIFSGGLEFSFDTRDDRISPHGGYQISLGGSFGSKTTTDSLGFSSIASISSLSANLEADLPIIGQRLIGFVGVQAREVNSDALEISDLFRVGGLSTLRGYREATYFASRYLIARIEPRLFLTARTYLGIFVDGGALEQVKYGGVPQHKWTAVGYGISMLFDTQIGFVEGAVALARGVPLDGAVLHLGLRTAF